VSGREDRCRLCLLAATAAELWHPEEPASAEAILFLRK